MGRVMDALASEQANQYSQALSAAVVRGHNQRTAQKWRTRGVAPYGYGREYHSPDGKQTITAKRTDRFKAPGKWGLKLTINEAEAKIVRHIFAEYVAGKSILGITRELNAKGITKPYAHRPTGLFKYNQWGQTTIHAILDNRAYIGVYEVGKESAKKSLNRIDRQTVAEACPIIVDVDVFNAAAKLRATKKARNIRTRNDAGGSMNGVLFCGCCGKPLKRKGNWSGKHTRTRLIYYVCDNSNENPASQCKSWRVREDTIMPLVLAHVVESLDWETLKALDAKPSAKAGPDLDALRKRHAGLLRDIETATANLMLASPKTFQLMAKKLEDWQAEADGLANTIKLATVMGPEAERRHRLEWLRSVKDRLVLMIGAEGMAEATPHPLEPSRHQLETIRELLGEGVAGTVHVDGEPVTVGVDEDDGSVTYWHYERKTYPGVYPPAGWVNRPPKPAILAEGSAVTR